jgi:sialic acid synthase SpsE
MNDVNLLAMYDIKRSLNLTNIGYSDHTLGIEIPIAAVSLGARVIEKHFTLDRNMNGPDHAASLEPYELIKMVKAIRNIELALNGDGLKKPSKSELKNISVARKSIHLNTNVKKGDIISENMLTTLRPGDGISPMKIPKLIGKKFNKTLNSLTKLKFEDFE